jgi:hypothetical protein
MLPVFIIIPILAALLGWILMTLCIRWILYRYLPSQKPALARAAGNLLQQQLLEQPMLAEKLAGQDTINSILPTIETEIDHFLRVRLKESMPVVGMFIGEKTIGQLKSVFMDELVRLFPQIMIQLAARLPEKLNLPELFKEKMETVRQADWQQFVQTHLGASSRQFALVGALLGFLVSAFTLGLAALFS